MERESKLEEKSEAVNSETVVRISAIETDTQNKEMFSKDKSSCQTLLLPRGRKMQSFDLNGKVEFINRAIKNSNSSSQLLLNSHKKISFISKSRKNSRVTNRSVFKKSNESIKSFSVQKHEPTLSMKMSQKKQLKMRDNLNISSFQNKFKGSSSTKNMFGYKEIELKRAGQRTFGMKNYSNYEKKKQLQGVKNSSNVQSESNLKKSFGMNLTEKFESGKKKELSKNESYGCLVNSRKKTSENFKVKGGQILTINQKLMKRTKSHANRLGVNTLAGCMGVNKHRLDVEHKKSGSLHPVFSNVGSNSVSKNATSQNSNGQEVNYIDKSIEADGDLYNEEHANLYQNERQESCVGCEQIIKEVVVGCSSCEYLMRVQEFVVSPLTFETCVECVRKFVELQQECVCKEEQRVRNITFGCVGTNVNKMDYRPGVGFSVKDLDQLDYIEESEELSMRLSRRNNSEQMKNDEDDDVKEESKEKPCIDLEQGVEQEDYFKNNNLKRYKHQEVRNFFVASPAENSKNFNFTNKIKAKKKISDVFNMRSKGGGGSGVLLGNGSPTWTRISSQNSSKLQIKTQSLRKGLNDLGKKKIIKLDISNQDGLEGKTENREMGTLEVSHREKSLNPLLNKGKPMKRNQTTKNLRQFEFIQGRLNNPGKE